MVENMKNIDVEARVKRARELFLSGYNCAQSVFMTYSDLFELEPELAAKISASMGGGMGRLREVCGAVSGMSLLAGFISPSVDPMDRVAKSENYSLVQEFAEQFRVQNGAIVCRELLGLVQRKDEPTPSERTPEYYRKRPCVEYVACAAEIVGKKLAQTVNKE